MGLSKTLMNHLRGKIDSALRKQYRGGRSRSSVWCGRSRRAQRYQGEYYQFECRPASFIFHVIPRALFTIALIHSLDSECIRNEWQLSFEMISGMDHISYFKYSRIDHFFYLSFRILSVICHILVPFAPETRASLLRSSCYPMTFGIYPKKKT